MDLMSQPVGKLVAVGAVSLVTGVVLDRYVFNSKRSKGTKLTGKRPKRAAPPPAGEQESSEPESEESEDEGIDIDSSDLNSVPGEVRMTLVVRQDLKMGKGKAAAQCLHATLALYKKITNPGSPAYNPDMVNRWEWQNGQAKITLQVPDAETMDLLFAQAISLGINAYIVHDAGRTQIASGSATVLGLGPAPKAVMDQITGELKLY